MKKPSRTFVSVLAFVFAFFLTPASFEQQLAVGLQSQARIAIWGPADKSAINNKEFPEIRGSFEPRWVNNKYYGELLLGVFGPEGCWINGGWSRTCPSKAWLSTSVWDAPPPTSGWKFFSRSGHGMPAAAKLPEGRYTVYAAQPGLEPLAVSNFYVDRTPPKCTITSPVYTPISGRDHHWTPEDPYITTDQTLPPVTGTAADALTDVERVEVSLVRLSDRFSWDGYRWDAHHRSPLCTIPGGRTWSCTKPLPSGPSLLLGQYLIYAWAYDKASNRSMSFINVLVAPKREEQRPPRKPS